MNIPDYNKDILGSSRRCEKYLKEHYPEFLDLLNEKYGENEKIPVKLYMYYNHIESHPACPICGESLPYISQALGFRSYCSIKCATNAKEVQEKALNTNKERYGGTGYASKTLLKKSESTTQDRYGCRNIMNTDFGKEAIKQTCLKRYGVSCYCKTNGFDEKSRNTKMVRYGGFLSKSPALAKKISDTKRQQTIESKEDILEVGREENGSIYYTCKCDDPECQLCKEKKFNIESHLYFFRSNNESRICTVANPVGMHMKDTSIELIVRGILEKNNILYNTQKPIGGHKSLDFYLPSYKKGIEVNEIYWHSINHDPGNKEKHTIKFRECANNYNISLISLWEDQIRSHPDLIEDVILRSIGKMNKVKSSKYNIIEISADSADAFMEKNYIYGSKIASPGTKFISINNILGECICVCNYSIKKGAIHIYHITYARGCVCTDLVVHLKKYFSDAPIFLSLYNDLGCNEYIEGKIKYRLANHWYINKENGKFNRIKIRQNTNPEDYSRWIEIYDSGITVKRA